MIALRNDFWPLGLFCDKHSRKHNIPTLFFGQERPSFNCSYQKVIQVELTNTNKKFAYHIAKIFFKTIKIFFLFILFSTWIHIFQKRIYWTTI
jgi:hypothetical protein